MKTNSCQPNFTSIYSVNQAELLHMTAEELKPLIRNLKCQDSKTTKFLYTGGKIKFSAPKTSGAKIYEILNQRTNGLRSFDIQPHHYVKTTNSLDRLI